MRRNTKLLPNSSLLGVAIWRFDVIHVKYIRICVSVSCIMNYITIVRELDPCIHLYITLKVCTCMCVCLCTCMCVSLLETEVDQRWAQRLYLLDLDLMLTLWDHWNALTQQCHEEDNSLQDFYTGNCPVHERNWEAAAGARCLKALIRDHLHQLWWHGNWSSLQAI